MDTLERLKRRRELATPDERISGFVFSALMQVVARSLGDTPIAELRARGHFPKRVIPFLKYPGADFLALTQVLVEHRLAGGEQLHPVLESVGDVGTRSFLESPPGQLMQTLNGANVHRMLAYAAVAYDITYSFGTRKVERESERSAELRYSGDVLGPSVQSGVVKVGLGLPCNVQITTTLVDCDDNGRNFCLGIAW